MKPLLTILLATLCAATGYGQTIKALSYNSTNNTVVATQRVTFPLLGVASGTAAIPSLTYVSGTNLFGTFAASAPGIGPHLGFSVDGTRRFYIATNTIRAELPISFSTTTNAAETRTNLSLGLPALTNTSNVTAMRALAGSTNTNEPYSGAVELSDGVISWLLTFSNGILVNLAEQ
jgi:hypothetical protein